jgi:hypothetical protein
MRLAPLKISSIFMFSLLSTIHSCIQLSKVKATRDLDAQHPKGYIQNDEHETLNQI